MASTFTEDFDGGSNGVTITAGNSGYDGFTAATSPVFSNAQAHSGTLSALYAVSATTCSARISFSATGLRFFRFYIYLSSNPGGNTQVYSVYSSGTQRGDLRITSAGKIQIRNGTTAVHTTTASLTLNAWNRVEWRVDNTNSQQQVRLYLGANCDGSTADEDTGNRTYNTGTFDRHIAGTHASGTLTYYIDDDAADDATWVGPAITSQDGTFTTAVGTATADGGSTTLSGDAGFGTVVGSATADGGSTTLTGGATFATTVATATAEGGSTSFLSGATFTTLVGTAAADGGSTTLSGSATFTTVVATATADGGSGSFEAGGSATFDTTAGSATADGGVSSFVATASTLIRLGKITAQSSL